MKRSKSETCGTGFSQAKRFDGSDTLEAPPSKPDHRNQPVNDPIKETFRNTFENTKQKKTEHLNPKHRRRKKKKPRRHQSYGIILVDIFSSPVRFLTVQRKDSYGYIDFIRNDRLQAIHINECFKTLTKDEIFKLQVLSFRDLVKDLYHVPYHVKHSMSLPPDIIIQRWEEKFSRFCVKQLVQNMNGGHDEADWGFPKGKRERKETEWECAIRECKEETGIRAQYFEQIPDVKIQEHFTGTDGHIYMHTYFLAKLTHPMSWKERIRRTKETRKIEWKTIQDFVECLKHYQQKQYKSLMNKLKHIQEHLYESSDSSGDGEGEETDSLKEQLFLLRKLYLCKHFSEIDENMYQIEIGKNGFLIGKVSTMKETKTYWLSNEKTVIIKNQNTMNNKIVSMKEMTVQTIIKDFSVGLTQKDIEIISKSNTSDLIRSLNTKIKLLQFLEN